MDDNEVEVPVFHLDAGQPLPAWAVEEIADRLDNYLDNLLEEYRDGTLVEGRPAPEEEK